MMKANVRLVQSPAQPESDDGEFGDFLRRTLLQVRDSIIQGRKTAASMPTDRQAMNPASTCKHYRIALSRMIVISYWKYWW